MMGILVEFNPPPEIEQNSPAWVNEVKQRAKEIVKDYTTLRDTGYLEIVHIFILISEKNRYELIDLLLDIRECVTQDYGIPADELGIQLFA